MDILVESQFKDRFFLLLLLLLVYHIGNNTIGKRRRRQKRRFEKKNPTSIANDLWNIRIKLNKENAIKASIYHGNSKHKRNVYDKTTTQQMIIKMTICLRFLGSCHSLTLFCWTSPSCSLTLLLMMRFNHACYTGTELIRDKPNDKIKRIDGISIIWRQDNF